MKVLLPILALLFGFSFANAQCYQNNHKSKTYIVGYSSCGCPIYQKKVLVGYDCRNYPIYKYYSVPSKCKCRRTYNTNRCNNRTYYNRGYNRDYNRSYNNRYHNSYTHSRRYYNNCSSGRSTITYTYRR